MNFLKSIAAVLALTLVISSCKKDSVVAPAATNKIAFIYKTDNADAVAFQSLMQANNATVTLIEQSSVASADFSGYKLIVVGHNTPDTWTDADANAVALSNVLNGKPSPYRDVALLNAAAALIVAGRAGDLKEGVAIGAKSLDSGAAAARLKHLIAVSRG